MSSSEDVPVADDDAGALVDPGGVALVAEGGQPRPQIVEIDILGW